MSTEINGIQTFFNAFDQYLLHPEIPELLTTLHKNNTSYLYTLNCDIIIYMLRYLLTYICEWPVFTTMFGKMRHGPRISVGPNKRMVHYSNNKLHGVHEEEHHGHTYMREYWDNSRRHGWEKLWTYERKSGKNRLIVCRRYNYGVMWELVHEGYWFVCDNIFVESYRIIWYHNKVGSRPNWTKHRQGVYTLID